MAEEVILRGVHCDVKEDPTTGEKALTFAEVVPIGTTGDAMVIKLIVVPLQDELAKELARKLNGSKLSVAKRVPPPPPGI